MIPRFMMMKNKKRTQHIKHLMPSLREKKRFVAFQVECAESCTAGQVHKAVVQSYYHLFGSLGLAEAGLLVFNNAFRQTQKKGIIKVNHKHVDRLRASLCFINNINNRPASMRSLGVSGMLQKTEKNFLI